MESAEAPVWLALGVVRPSATDTLETIKLGYIPIASVDEAIRAYDAIMSQAQALRANQPEEEPVT